MGSSKFFKRLGLALTGMALAIGVGVGLSQRGEYKEARAATSTGSATILLGKASATTWAIGKGTGVTNSHSTCNPAWAAPDGDAGGTFSDTISNNDDNGQKWTVDWTYTGAFYQTCNGGDPTSVTFGKGGVSSSVLTFTSTPLTQAMTLSSFSCKYGDSSKASTVRGSLYYDSTLIVQGDKTSSSANETKTVSYTTGTLIIPKDSVLKVVFSDMANGVSVYDIQYTLASATTYTVSFNSNGGTPAPSNSTVSDGATFTFPSPGTKSGYRFLGWSSDGGTTKYATGVTSPAVTAAIEYTAYWEANVNPTVNLDKNSLDLTIFGASDNGTVTASTENITSPTYSWARVSGDDCVTLTNADTATVNIASKGTALSASATIRLTVNGRNQANTEDIDPITKDVTVNVSKSSSTEHPYTVAEATTIISTLAQNANSDSLYVSGIVYSVESVAVSSGKLTYWISDDGSETGKMKVYNGKGLNNANFTAVSDVFAGDQVVVYGTLSQQYANINANNYLTSQTKKTYTVSFDGNGGTGSITNKTINRGSYSLPANEFTAPASKEFSGWKIKIGEETQETLRAVGYEHTLTSNITLVAQWNDLVTITYVKNDENATGTMDPVSYGSGATATVLENGFTAASGKIFSGWYTTSNGTGGVAYTVGQEFTISADVILYAQWADKVTLTYNANGGSNAPASVDYATGATATAASGSGLTAPNANLAFSKWNTAPDGSGTYYLEGAEFTINENITLYAVWGDLPLTIGTNGCSDVSEETALNWSTIGTGGTKVSDIYYNGIRYEVTGTGNNGKVYSGPSWRFYYDGGSSSALKLSIVENDDALRIKSVKVTFSVANNGVLKYNSTTLTSGTALDLSGSNLNNIILKVDHTSGSTGNVNISKIETVIGYKSTFEAAQVFENTYVKRNIAYPNSIPTGVEGTNCLSTEKGGLGYYDTAVTEYNKLSSDAKIWFATRNEFENARARMIAWAAANNEAIEFNTTTGAIQVASRINNDFITSASSKSNSTLVAIIIIAGVSTLAIGGYFFIRRRKER